MTKEVLSLHELAFNIAMLRAEGCVRFTRSAPYHKRAIRNSGQIGYIEPVRLARPISFSCKPLVLMAITQLQMFGLFD